MNRIFPIVALAIVVVSSIGVSPRALAADDIGAATKIVRTVTGRLAGNTSKLSQGARVFRNQRLSAASASLGQFRFRDDTRLALNANSSVKLDKFVYSGSGTSGSQLLLRAARGAFRFATGSMPARAYRIETPSSSIGVRGTWFDVYVGRRKQTIVTLLSGRVQACNRAGRCITLSRPCEAVRIELNGRITTAARPNEAILAGEPATRAIPFLVSQYYLSRSLRVPSRTAARCSNLTQVDEESNLDGSGEGGESDSEGNGGGGGAGGPSDIRLKRDVYAIGHLSNGLPLYRFKYTWSDQEWVGVMAQDVLKVMPQAVSKGAEGYYQVNYQMLGIKLLRYNRWLELKSEQTSKVSAP